MRIALVIERFEPRSGGAEAAAWEVAHGLARAGDDVRVVARRAAPGSRVPVRRVEVSSAWQPWRVLAFSRAAARAAPRGSVDVVYSFSRTTHQDVYRAGAGSHLDYLARRHRLVSRTLRRASPRHAVLADRERRIFADASQLVHCGSAWVSREIQARHGIAPGRLRVLRNGVDLERFHPATGAARSGEPVWLFAGRGFHRKGLDTALAALAACRRGSPRLRVAGPDPPGPWRARARRLGVESRVSFLGPRDDMVSVYRESDGLLLPTRYDAFANVCLEAAACGLPVVTSASNGAAEIFASGPGIVPDAEDAAGFARALDAHSDTAARRRAGEAALAVARSFDWNAHVDALRGLFREVAG